MKSILLKVLSSTLVVCLLLASHGVKAGKEKRNVKKLSKQDWIQVSSPNFLITSNAEPEKIQDVAVQLEEFRFFVSEYMGLKQVEGLPPIRFLVLDDSDTFDLLGLNSRIAGIFTETLGGFISIANGDDFSSSKRSMSFGKSTIMHEMVHYFNHNQVTDIQYPFWYEEGVAEYLSTMTNFDGKITFGKMNVIKNRFWELLKRTGKCCMSVEIEQLLKYKKNSEGKKPRALYARGFILVHYLNTSAEKRQQLFRYLNLVNSGKSVDEAFSQSFDVSYEELTEQVDDYLAGRKVFGRVFPVGPSGIDFPTFATKTRKLSPIEGVYESLDITLQFRGSSNGKLKPANTIRAFSQLFPESDLDLLLDSLYNNKLIISQKLNLLFSFIESHPNHDLALTKLGRLYLLLADKNRLRGKQKWTEHNEKAQQYLIKALEANPTNGLAHYNLAKTHEYLAYENMDLKQAIYSLEVAQLFQDRYSAHKLEALYRLPAKQYFEAEKSFKRVIALSDSHWARGMATWIRDGLNVINSQKLEQSISENVITYSNGARYSGVIQAGVPHGEGTFVAGNGSTYTGHWQQGLPNGQGKFEATNGMVYQGQYKDGAAYGEGTLDYSGHNGSVLKYQGDFFQFVPHGPGKEFEKGGITLTGNWFKGQQHDVHTLTNRRGKSVDIPYYYGKVMYLEEDGTIFSGNISRKTFKPKGKGRCKPPTSTYFKSCKR